MQIDALGWCRNGDVYSRNHHRSWNVWYHLATGERQRRDPEWMKRSAG